jgi:RimJ/RimL family protein N-acetyltransferase
MEMAMATLETERLVLRQMTPQDVDHLLGIFSDPVAMRHYPATKDRSETEDWVATNLRRYAEVGLGLWVVELKESGQFIGTCGLTMQEVDGVWEPGLGYLFLRASWGRGYATEAAAACVDYGFARLACHRIICLTTPDNAPSRRVAARLGMHLEREVERRGQRVCVFALDRPGRQAAIGNDRP